VVSDTVRRLFLFVAFSQGLLDGRSALITDFDTLERDVLLVQSGWLVISSLVSS
jgi:hypothetical protein